MSSKSVLTAVIEHAFSQEPCLSCQVAGDWRKYWFNGLPEMFKCEIEESYPCCPWTGRTFPWTRTAAKANATTRRIYNKEREE